MEPSLLPQISIIICTNRAPETIDGLFHSLNRQSALERCEVIMVNNGIALSRVEKVRRQLDQLPCSSLYLDEQRPGLWHARSSAFAKASGEWILLLDDDNELAEAAIEHLLSFVAQHPGVGGICPRVVAQWEYCPDVWLQRFGTCCLSFTESGSFYPDYGETIWALPRPPVLRPPGGGMIIHRRISEAFLSSFSLLPDTITQPSIPCEDHAIFCGVGRCAMDSAYVPKIVVYHHIDSARTSLAALSRLNFRMIRGYGLFTPFESLFSGDNKSWFRRIGGFVAGELQLTMSHPKTWWLVLVRVVAFLSGVVHGQVLHRTVSRKCVGKDG